MQKGGPNACLNGVLMFWSALLTVILIVGGYAAAADLGDASGQQINKKLRCKIPWLRL